MVMVMRGRMKRMSSTDRTRRENFLGEKCLFSVLCISHNCPVAYDSVFLGEEIERERERKRKKEREIQTPQVSSLYVCVSVLFVCVTCVAHSQLHRYLKSDLTSYCEKYHSSIWQVQLHPPSLNTVSVEEGNEEEEESKRQRRRRRRRRRRRSKKRKKLRGSVETRE